MAGFLCACSFVEGSGVSDAGDVDGSALAVVVVDAAAAVFSILPVRSARRVSVPQIETC